MNLWCGIESDFILSSRNARACGCKIYDPIPLKCPTITIGHVIGAWVLNFIIILKNIYVGVGWDWQTIILWKALRVLSLNVAPINSNPSRFCIDVLGHVMVLVYNISKPWLSNVCI